MPTPAAPTIVTSSQPGPTRARSHASASASSSLLRPTSGESKRRSAAAVDTATSRQAATRVAFALQRQRLDRLHLDGVAGQAQRRPVEQSLTGLRGLLEARGHVHGVTCRQPLRRAGDHLATADADSALDAQCGQRRLHLRRRPQRAHGIVLVHRRQPEDRHHRVADELLDDPAVALDDRLHALEVAREQGTERLGVERLAESRRSGDVTEQDRDDLALLAPACARLRAALGTEPESAGGLVPAHGAGGHTASLGTSGHSNKAPESPVYRCERVVRRL